MGKGERHKEKGNKENDVLTGVCVEIDAGMNEENTKS